MVNELGILGLTILYAALFAWAFRALPREGWQFVASVPHYKSPDGKWIGMNLTYYGVFSASGVALAGMIVAVLMGSLSMPVIVIGIICAVLLACCVPTAKLAAKIIEAKANTFSIGGAVFVGILIAPWALLLTDLIAQSVLKFDVPVLPSLAALAIAYAFGEGTGRLACISFGCCYGKPLSIVYRGPSKLFGTCCFIFTGTTKKVAYEGGLEAVPVVPIQAITAIILVGAGLLGTVLFLQGNMPAAFLSTWLLTQTWRIVSEFLRADYRGEGYFSVYQILAVAGAVYGLAAVPILPNEEAIRPDLLSGFHTLWNPAVILVIQIAWLGIFWYTGRSKVTASTMWFSVLRDRI